jgi:hypothetical protein
MGNAATIYWAGRGGRPEYLRPLLPSSRSRSGRFGASSGFALGPLLPVAPLPPVGVRLSRSHSLPASRASGGAPAGRRRPPVVPPYTSPPSVLGDPDLVDLRHHVPCGPLPVVHPPPASPAVVGAPVSVDPPPAAPGCPPPPATPLPCVGGSVSVLPPGMFAQSAVASPFGFVSVACVAPSLI